MLVEVNVNSTPWFCNLPKFCQLEEKPVTIEVGTWNNKSVVVLL